MKSKKFRVFHDSKTDLRSEKDFWVNEDDLAEQLLGLTPEDKFLGTFTREEIEELIQQNGVFSALQELGFSEIKLSLRLKDNFEHVLRLYDSVENPKNLLAEMVVRKAFLPAGAFSTKQEIPAKIEVLFVEWLQAQNPRLAVSEKRPLLPGQRFSGLGLATRLLDLLVVFVKRIDAFAIAAIPGHYHNAVIFSKYFRYIKPESEGRLTALKRDLLQVELSQLSWAVEFNCIKILNTGKYLKWFLDWQVLPIRQELRQYFNSEAYRIKVEEIASKYKFELDQKMFETKKSKINRIKEAII